MTPAGSCDSHDQASCSHNKEGNTGKTNSNLTARPKNKNKIEDHTFCCRWLHPWLPPAVQRQNPKKSWCRSYLYNLTLCPLQSRLYHGGQPYARVDLSSSQGLWIWPLREDWGGGGEGGLRSSSNYSWKRVILCLFLVHESLTKIRVL